MSDEAFLWPSPPTSTDLVDAGQSYVMGVAFSVAANQTCDGIQWRVPDTLAPPFGGGIYAAILYEDVSGLRVGYQEFTPVAGGNQSVLFATPVALTGGTAYVACVYTLHYTFRSGSPAGVTTTNSLATAIEGRLGSYNGGAATAVRPNGAFSATYYVSPLLLSPAGGGVTTSGTGIVSMSGTAVDTTGRTTAKTAIVSMSSSSAVATDRTTSGTASVSLRTSFPASGGSTTGVHYEIEQVMDALAAIFDGVPTGDTIGGTAITVEAHAEVVGQVEPPAIVLELDNQDFDLTMGHGSDSLSVVALLLVTYADTDNAQRLLWRFLSRGSGSGLFRVKAALEADQTLGGLASYAIMSTVRNIGIITYNGVSYLGAELIIEVML